LWLLLMSWSYTTVSGLVFRVPLAQLSLPVALVLIIPRHLRLPCPGCVDHVFCRSQIPPIRGIIAMRNHIDPSLFFFGHNG
jgi:hypothetical protein